MKTEKYMSDKYESPIMEMVELAKCFADNATDISGIGILDPENEEDWE
ncbi:hypothetical protein FACS189429_5850 [Bacteroidia bacterium]|nr:hypothetical protein FACS189429_5850 [Bacteroidia bacterium]